MDQISVHKQCVIGFMATFWANKVADDTCTEVIPKVTLNNY